MRLGAFLLVCSLAAFAAAQTKAPPPNAKDVPVPSRPGVPSGGPDQGVVNGVLSADDAVRITLAKQPTLESVRQAVIAAEGRTRQVRAALLPQFGIGATYYSSRFVGDEPNRLALNVPNGYGTSAAITQLVYDSHHSSDLVKQSSALKDVAVQDLQKAKEDLALQALDGYYLVGEAHNLVQVNERNVNNRDSQLALAQARFKSGIGGADDVLTAQTAKGDAVVSLVLARTTEDSARVSLLQTLGLDPQTPVKIGDDKAAPVPVDNYDQFVGQAVQRRPEVLRAKSNIDAAKFGARAAKTVNTPVLSGSLNFSTNDPGFPNGGGGAGLGLILSVPIYDGGFRSGKIKEADALLKSAQSDLTTAQLQVRTDVSQAYLALRGAEQRDDASQLNLSNAQESLRIAEGRYKAGLGLFLDIINAQAALLSAETNAAMSAGDVWRDRAALKHAAALLDVH